MNKDEIAWIINPEHPWVYAPTTAPTKIIMNDGSIKVGYFQYIQKSAELEKINNYTFVEFGENANLYRATGDPKYITELDGNLIVAVEYPAAIGKDIPLDSLMRKISNLVLELERNNLTSFDAILFAANFRLDWGFHIKSSSNEFSAGETKQLLAEGLSLPKSGIWQTNSFSDVNRVTLLLEDFLKLSKLSEKQIRELHNLVTGYTSNYRNFEVSIHHRKPSKSNFTPAFQVANEMSSLVSWYNDSIQNLKTNPIILAGMFHYRFVSIHPFSDGNGRIARVITSLILLKFKIPPPRVSLDNRIFYLSALENADNGNYEAWIRFFAKEVLKSIEDLLSENRSK